MNGPSPPRLELTRSAPDILELRLSGSWRMGSTLPSLEEATGLLAGGCRRIVFLAGALEGWDSALLGFLSRLEAACGPLEVEIDPGGLPIGVRRLLDLAHAAPEREETPREANPVSLLARLGEVVLERRQAGRDFIFFMGGLTVALGRMLAGRARFRRSELWLFIQQSGSQALGIVSLISFLVGVILAFVGAVQLSMFGAEIFIANLVGIGMARDMGAMMTGIIMAGRTGSSFAAQLGTMQVNEEIDALRTLGLPPMEFLVLPRMIAMVLMMPLLTCYSDLLGILGGALVGIGMFDITPMQYYLQTVEAVPMVHFGVGVAKSLVYGAVVALAGCMKGLQCGSSASAVGEATTSAVVTAIIWIVVWCAILTVIFHILGI